MNRDGVAGGPGPKYTATKRLSLYVVFSGLAALVNFGSRFGYDHALAGFLESTQAYVLGVAFAYLTGMVVNFVLSKYVTFQAQKSGRVRREAVKFLAIAMVGLLTTVAGSYLAYASLSFIAGALELARLPDDLLKTAAHLCGMGLGLAVNFIGHDRFSFRPTGAWDRMMTAFGKLPKPNEQEDAQ